MKMRPEIMAPAGSWTALQAALDAGCDAVYFGVQGMNMRAAADNFTCNDMSEIAARCHEKKVAAYLALNVIVYEHECDTARSIIHAAHTAGIDAVICWDHAVIAMARDIGLPVFLSTQASVSNTESLLFYHTACGVRRFVLARECSLDDIHAIRSELRTRLGDAADSIQLEAFIHGAMCVSISGRCFMSQFEHGMSANRGECLQPCRRLYTITCDDQDTSFSLGQQYVMSPKDVCTLPFIEKLIDAGLNSFKIEGRNRSPEYVSVVTSVYRRAVDVYCDSGGGPSFEELKKELIEQLRSVYNRGFSSGFYMGTPLNEWTEKYGSRASTVKVYSGKVIKYYKKPKVAEVLVENEEFSEGDTLMFQGPTTGVVTLKAESIEQEHACITRACRGERVAVYTGSRVRSSDRLYVVRSVER